MISKLKERLLEAITAMNARRKAEGYPALKNADLAKAGKCTDASVSDWLSGKSKNIRAIHLFPLARFLDVNPEWLGVGVGPKEPNHATRFTVNEPSVYQWSEAAPAWPFQDIPPNDFKKLTGSERGQIEDFARFLLQAKQPPRKSRGATS
jgi:transcriptional regulator with XRE-family HTH domain